jgi:hypothetical protein
MCQATYLFVAKMHIVDMESSLGDVGGSTVVLFEIGKGHEKKCPLVKSDGSCQREYRRTPR